MSTLRGSELPDWIQEKKFNRKELETLKEILPFYIINTLHESYSYRSIPVTEYGWPENIWNTGALKDQLFYVANLTMNHNLFVVERLEDMSGVCKQAHLDDQFYQYRDLERIVVYVNSRTNLVLSIFKHIRNSLAHGRFVMYPMGEDYMFVMESVDNSRGGLVVKARMVLRASTLMKWMEIIRKGPEESMQRKRKKK